MSALTFRHSAGRVRVGLKGPRAAEWLHSQDIALPPVPNTWTEGAPLAAGGTTAGDAAAADAALLLARLGTSEFFLEGGAADGGDTDGEAVVRRIAAAMHTPAPGIYPVLREDAAFVLAGDGALDVLAQVCNVNFGALDLAARPVIMTLLIGVAVLVVPQLAGPAVRYRIWCDPTFGAYLDESIGTVVIDCGGSHGGVSA